MMTQFSTRESEPANPTTLKVWRCVTLGFAGAGGRGSNDQLASGFDP